MEEQNRLYRLNDVAHVAGSINKEFWVDEPLVSTFIERWCPKTHIFHMPFKERTITSPTDYVPKPLQGCHKLCPFEVIIFSSSKDFNSSNYSLGVPRIMFLNRCKGVVNYGHLMVFINRCRGVTDYVEMINCGRQPQFI
ncbi:hypothetical protein Ahy_A04g020715 [Arachis hypogaea]|uniref:Aminotransferase-like plant mobile domain-containing protein n=1 Tax=Arachis hypogaea TaxID=3818 RepID=A0A445DIE8_ARAHY|nr:hypothetical protein Ahy_A04g020715 [Arachis hypogaea]